MSEITVAEVANKALDKSEVLVTKVAEISNNMFDAASNLLKHSIEQYGPAALDAVLWVVRINGIQELVYGLIYTIIPLTVIYLVNLSKTRMNLWSWIHETEGGSIVGALIATIISMLVMFMAGLPRITDTWNYVAVVKPEIYLVKKAIDAVEKKLDVATKK